MLPKEEVIKFLGNFGIDYNRIIAFIKKDCKIERGFEAQRVGLKVPSATTTGLITYILGELGELETDDELTLKKEILSFRKNREAFDDSAFGSQLYSSVWATSQCLLGLLSLKTISHQEVEKSIKWLCKVQSEGGGWSFSGMEEDKIIYAPYSVLALIRYYKRFADESILYNLKRAYNYSMTFKPENNIDKIIKEWLLRVIEEAGIISGKRQNDKIKINFAEIIESEFASYIIYEHSIYPFSMQYYTPASYLFTRKFLHPTHPFNLYLVKYLIINQVNGRYWSHITSQEKNIAYSFCTAFSIFSLYLWAHDILKNRIRFKKFPSIKQLSHQVNRVSYKLPKIFISYSKVDKTMAERIANTLKQKGYVVWFDEWKIKVGDSIIDKINKGIVESDFLLVLLSKNSIKSKWVKEELNAAKMKEIAKRKVFILPVLLEDCEIPSLISDKRYADFRTSFSKGITEIMKTLEEVKR
ncbi:MAG: TIR domain-containing protein [Thaumarchaeota archaeon]|nr:TIR domain-containing protein [Nitrososphaerota archaeon]